MLSPPPFRSRSRRASKKSWNTSPTRCRSVKLTSTPSPPHVQMEVPRFWFHALAIITLRIRSARSCHIRVFYCVRRANFGSAASHVGGKFCPDGCRVSPTFARLGRDIVVADVDPTAANRIHIGETRSVGQNVTVKDRARPWNGGCAIKAAIAVPLLKRAGFNSITNLPCCTATSSPGPNPKRR